MLNRQYVNKYQWVFLFIEVNLEMFGRQHSGKTNVIFDRELVLIVLLLFFRGTDKVAVKAFHAKHDVSWQREADIYSTPLRNESILRFIAADIRGNA